MTDGTERRLDVIDRVAPNSPHAEAFWHDIGRPPEGQNGSAKVTSADESVQRACPTRYDPSAYTVADAYAAFLAEALPLYERGEIDNATWCGRRVDLAAESERRRLDLIERLAPLEAPYETPRQETL